MQKLKTQKGITLVALIITIIVMLILVAVTLVITLGDNGIIAKAREASRGLNDRQEAEKSTFSSADAEGKINDVVAGGTWNIDTGKEAGGSVGKKYYGDPAGASAFDLENGVEYAYWLDGDVWYYAGRPRTVISKDDKLFSDFCSDLSITAETTDEFADEVIASPDKSGYYFMVFNSDYSKNTWFTTYDFEYPSFTGDNATNEITDSELIEDLNNAILSE